jgi:hypothetical protein
MVFRAYLVTQSQPLDLPNFFVKSVHVIYPLSCPNQPLNLTTTAIAVSQMSQRQLNGHQKQSKSLGPFRADGSDSNMDDELNLEGPLQVYDPTESKDAAWRKRGILLPSGPESRISRDENAVVILNHQRSSSGPEDDPFLLCSVTTQHHELVHACGVSKQF